MPRKKKTESGVAAGEANSTSIATYAPPIIEAEVIGRPAWIDGAPVSEEGRVIRKGSPEPSPQMELAGQAEESQSQQGESETAQHRKNWGDPYKSIFSCREMGFELGENRRFKQRVFRFSEKPASEILSELKEHGFIYRAAEKAWTVNATADSRKLTDELARKWAGPNYVRSVER